MPKKSELQVTDDELKEEYESGLTIQDLADKYGCGNTTMHRRLVNVGCKMRTINEHKKGCEPYNKIYLPITDIELKRDYESGISVYQLADMYGCTVGVIIKHLKSAGTKMRAGRANRKSIAATNDELVKEYESGLNSVELAKKYGCSTNLILRRLKSIGCEIRDKRTCQEIIIIPIIDFQLKEEYESGLTIQDLADKYGCGNTTILKHLTSTSCEMRGAVTLPVTNDELVKEYESGLSALKLAGKYSCSDATIRERLKSAGSEMRVRKVTLPVTNDELVKEYESGLNSVELAKKYGCSYSLIINRLKDEGCKIRVNKGENHSFWKGGSSFEPYCPKFNESFKESIRNKFDRKCFICDITEKEMQDDQRRRGKLVCRLPIHHVDYNKDCLCDDSECEFVPLCLSHHAKTNHNREYWESVILQKINALKMYDSNDIGGQRTVFEFIA